MALATRVGGQDAVPTTYVGSYAGTTAAQTINIGFDPSAIIAWNRTDGDTVWFWSKADEVNLITLVALAATNSIVVTDTAGGFALPSNAVVNEDSKTYDFIAFR